MSFSGRKETEIKDTVITNDSFYHDIDVGHFQKTARINTEYRIEAIINRLKLAMVYVNGELKDKKEQWTIEGKENLASVNPENTIDEQTEHQIKYENAVYSHAKAYLLQDYATMNRRDEAENESKEASSTYESYMADCQDSLKWLNGNKDGKNEEGSLHVYQV